MQPWQKQLLSDWHWPCQSVPSCQDKTTLYLLNWIQHIDLHARKKSTTLGCIWFDWHIHCCAETHSAQHLQLLQRWKNPRSFRNCWLWQTLSSLVKFNWSKWLKRTKIRPTAAQKGPFWYCFENKDSDSKKGCWQQCFYLSACVESVRTALAALVPHSRLPPRKSKALPLLLSLMRSWMETGWMTGWLLRVVSCSGLSAWGASPGSESGCCPPGACWDWVMVREGWAAPSLKWVCSSVLMYSHTLGTHRRSNN